MPIAAITTLLALLLVPCAQSQTVMVHMFTSDLIDLTRMIAHGEGYDVTKTDVYSFDLIEGEGGKPFIKGYTTIGFYINASHRNLIAINDGTAQAIDVNTCEIFDYPELRPFQQQIIRLSKTPRKTEQQLAADVGCDSPQVRTEPVRPAKQE